MQFRRTFVILGVLGSVVLLGVFVILNRSHKSGMNETPRSEGRTDIASNSKASMMPPPPGLVEVLDGRRNFNERIIAARQIGPRLQAFEIGALYECLLRNDEDSLLKNELLNQLRNQVDPPIGLVDLLRTIYARRHEDVVMGHYAIQHLGAYYDRSSFEEKREIQKVLLSAAREADTEFAGTALLSLRQLTSKYAEVSTTEIGLSALRAASNPNAHPITRITALQLCGKMNLLQVLPLAVELAQSARNVSLQMAALATIGDLGDDTIRPMLSKFESDADLRVRTAAKSALHRLEVRLSKSSQNGSGDGIL